ncbi:MAG: SDR family oxidoreductase [Candidatus Helarchaeota archaeon]
MKRVLIIGASGLVGFHLYKWFQKSYIVLGTYNTHSFDFLIHLNIIDKKELKFRLNKFDPDIILLPAALSAVDYCESNKAECFAHNIQGPNNLIQLIKDRSVKLVFYSTDYIFDGKNGPYSENDKPNPLNNYGKAKLETEKNIQKHLKDYLILRITVVYGWELIGKNFIIRLINNLTKRQVIKVPMDQFGSPTYVENIAEATFKLIQLDKQGIYNVAGPQIMDRYNFALKAAKIFDLDSSFIKPVRTSILNQIALRPLKAGLKIDKLLNTIQIKMFNPHEGLLYMKKNKDFFDNLLF